MALFGFSRNLKQERAGFSLYGAAVAAAREPYFYEVLSVPDTIDGRFDLVGVHAALLIRRLRREPGKLGPALAQAVFDAMFSDMDINLREIGVGDLSVSKKVKAMWEAFHGRCLAYESALDAADSASLAAALARNVWRAEAAQAAVTLARIVMGQERALAAQDLAALAAGQVRFLPPQEALA